MILIQKEVYYHGKAGRGPANQPHLIIGIFAEVYLLDEKTIRKSPPTESEEDMQPIIREAMIYDIIGVHPRITECTALSRQWEG